jgi:hypothetical protein
LTRSAYYDPEFNTALGDASVYALKTVRAIAGRFPLMYGETDDGKPILAPDAETWITEAERKLVDLEDFLDRKRGSDPVP